MTTTNGSIDERTWEMLMQRFDGIDKRFDGLGDKITMGFKGLNGRVRRMEVNWAYMKGLGAIVTVTSLVVLGFKIFG